MKNIRVKMEVLRLCTHFFLPILIIAPSTVCLKIYLSASEVTTTTSGRHDLKMHQRANLHNRLQTNQKKPQPVNSCNTTEGECVIPNYGKSEVTLFTEAP